MKKLMLLLLAALGMGCLHLYASEGGKMENKRVLISGAGPAGLTLAYWLKQYGFIPTIVERRSSLPIEGQRLDLRGVALDVVKRMKAHAAIEGARTGIEKAAVVSRGGRSVKEMDVSTLNVRVKEDLEIRRGELCEILFDAMDDMEIIFGDSIESISERSEGVDVTFKYAGPQTFDLVVGADGLHSRVRKLVFGDDSLFVKDLGFYISLYEIPNYSNLNRKEIEYFEPGRFVTVYNCNGDMGASVGFIFPSDEARVGRNNVAEQQALLKQAFAHMGWDVPHILSLMEDSSGWFFDRVGQVHMPRWSEGRVALVGDAGYAVSPFSGQGTSVSMVGAYVLAGELAQADGDYKTAFVEYEQKLRGFVEQNQQLADTTVKIMKNKSWTAKLINHIMKFAPSRVILYFKTQGTEKAHKAAIALDLEDYNLKEIK